MGNPFFDFKKKDEQQNPGLYKDKSVVEKAKLAGKRYRAQKGSKKIKGGAALSPAPLSGGGAALSPALVSGGGLQPLTPTPLSGGKKNRKSSKKSKSKKNKSKKNKSKKNRTRKSRR